MSDLYRMNEAEFEQVLDAVQQDARGRAFLRIMAGRERAVALDDIRSVLDERREAGAPGAETRLDILNRELQEMGGAILKCRQEIAAIKPQSDGDNRIMAATEELDAILTATERATTDILAAAETVMELAGQFRNQGADPDLCDRLEGQATEVMMACSFQDITGQRTTRVVNLLRYLEQRVNALRRIWEPVDGAAIPEPAPGTEAAAGTGPATPPGDDRPDAHLLNGPQPEGQGVSQQDVDMMFAAADAGPAAPQPPAGPGMTPDAVTPDAVTPDIDDSPGSGPDTGDDDPGPAGVDGIAGNGAAANGGGLQPQAVAPAGTDRPVTPEGVAGGSPAPAPDQAPSGGHAAPLAADRVTDRGSGAERADPDNSGMGEFMDDPLPGDTPSGDTPSGDMSPGDRDAARAVMKIRALARILQGCPGIGESAGNGIRGGTGPAPSAADGAPVVPFRRPAAESDDSGSFRR